MSTEIVLGAKEVYRMGLDRTVRMTNPSAKQPESRPYYRATYKGTVFIVDQPFFDAFTTGQVVEIVLQSNTIKVKDALNPDAPEVDKERITFGTFATKDQMITAAQYVAEIAAIENPKVDAAVVTDAQLHLLQERLLGLGTK